MPKLLVNVPVLRLQYVIADWSIGLFKPRSGHKHRDQRRHFRSQYDRGTRFAVMEEERFERMEKYHGRGIHSGGSRQHRSDFSPVNENYYSHRQHGPSTGPYYRY
jgi:hypothetical protein